MTFFPPAPIFSLPRFEVVDVIALPFVPPAKDGEKEPAPVSGKTAYVNDAKIPVPPSSRNRVGLCWGRPKGTISRRKKEMREADEMAAWFANHAIAYDIAPVAEVHGVRLYSCERMFLRAGVLPCGRREECFSPKRCKYVPNEIREFKRREENIPEADDEINDEMF